MIDDRCRSPRGGSPTEGAAEYAERSDTETRAPSAIAPRTHDDDHLPHSPPPPGADAASVVHRRAGAARRRADRLLSSSARPSLRRSDSGVAADVQTQFTIVGRGWGHGIGMCQYGAYGYAKHGWRYKAILKHYYTGIGFGRVSNRSIRVMLNQGLSSVSVTSTAQLPGSGQRQDRASSAAGYTAKLTWTGSAYRLTVDGSTWDFGGPVTFQPGNAKLKLLNANQNGRVGRYRGTLRVIHYTGGFTVVNKVGLENYLYGVVPRESPSSWPAEALKAQACAARSYAARSLGKSAPYDVYCTAWSQVYNGFDGEAASTNSAVNTHRRCRADLRRPPDHRLLLLDLRRPHREHRERLGRQPGALPQGRPRPLRDRVAVPHLAREPEAQARRLDLAAQLGAYSSTHTWGVKGNLRAIYVVQRGVSPRVVTARGDRQQRRVDRSAAPGCAPSSACATPGSSFTSLSIDPSAATDKTITYGESTTVGGRRYPALADGAKVTLKYHPSGGAWASRTVTSGRHSASLAGHTVRWSQYSARVDADCARPSTTSSPSRVSRHTRPSVCGRR